MWLRGATSALLTEGPYGNRRLPLPAPLYFSFGAGSPPMFERFDQSRGRKLPGFTLVSVGLHAFAITAFLVLAAMKVSKEAAKKEVEVAFIGPGKGKGAPPPPPPPAAKKRTATPHRKVLARIEVPKPVLEVPKVV